MALYSEKVMEHFRHPRNAGIIEDADGIGEVGNARCGDIMKIYLKIEDDIIVDAAFETFGCGSAIASSSMATELIKGKPVSEALTLTNQQSLRHWTVFRRIRFIALCLLKKQSGRPCRITILQSRIVECRVG